MNTLSWLLYAADVSDNLDGLLWYLALITTLGLVIWIFAMFVMRDRDSNPTPENWKTWRKIGGLLLIPSFLISWVGGAIVPAKETVYAIATSELGESALNTPTAGKAFKALDAWLDKQIKTETSLDISNTSATAK